MKNLLIKTAAISGFAMFTLHAYAQQGNGGMKMDMAAPKTVASRAGGLAMNEAEVKSVDKAEKTITIRHGPLQSKTVEMGPMTMTFPVQDISLLSNVKAGDKVVVAVDMAKDQATVTALTVQK